MRELTGTRTDTGLRQRLHGFWNNCLGAGECRCMRDESRVAANWRLGWRSCFGTVEAEKRGGW
jgi:hypothetical protein